MPREAMSAIPEEGRKPIKSAAKEQLLLAVDLSRLDTKNVKAVHDAAKVYAYQQARKLSMGATIIARADAQAAADPDKVMESVAEQLRGLVKNFAEAVQAGHAQAHYAEDQIFRRAGQLLSKLEQVRYQGQKGSRQAA